MTSLHRLFACLSAASLLTACDATPDVTPGGSTTADQSSATGSTSTRGEPTASTCAYGHDRLGTGGAGGAGGSSSGGGGAGGSTTVGSGGAGGIGGSIASSSGGGGASGGASPTSTTGSGGAGGCDTPPPDAASCNDGAWSCYDGDWNCSGCLGPPNGECCVMGGWTCDQEAGWVCGYTPLVLVFDDAAVRYTDAPLAAFDLSGLGASMATDWPTAATPWLALDRDGDGRIGAGDELFGSATRLASGARAANGFEALAELDGDKDGFITPNDPAFASLVLWSDADADRASKPAELSSLASRHVQWIELTYRAEPRCDARGNCEVERARFGFIDEAGHERTGAVVDLHLPSRTRDRL